MDDEAWGHGVISLTVAIPGMAYKMIIFVNFVFFFLKKGFLSTSSTHHHVDAERILQDVQRRRQNLDSNLEAVIRQREEQDLYNLVDNVTTTNR